MSLMRVSTACQNMFKWIHVLVFNQDLALSISVAFIFYTLKMSSDVVHSCVTCSSTVKGKQHYANCVVCSRRVHRKCYGEGLSRSEWTRIRQTFTCTLACEAVSRGHHFNSNYSSDCERQLVVDESMEKTHDVSTSVPPTTNQYYIMIGASQKGGDIVNDGCGYTYILKKDYSSSRVWRCTFRGCVKFPCCYSTLKQIKRPGVDFLRTYFQEDFTLNADKAHSHPPLNGAEKRAVGQSSSTISGTSLNFGNISTAESARVSADVGVSIDYQDPHVSNSGVATSKRKRCSVQRQENKKQSIVFSIDELFGDKR